jgi:hypothetical protein
MFHDFLLLTTRKTGCVVHVVRKYTFYFHSRVAHFPITSDGTGPRFLCFQALGEGIDESIAKLGLIL